MDIDDALTTARELLDEPHDVTHRAPQVMTVLLAEVERLRGENKRLRGIEARARQLAEQAPDPMFVIHPDSAARYILDGAA